MYATRYTQTSRFNPGGLAAAIVVNAAFVAALIFAAPTILTKLKDKPLTTYQVDEDTPPPPEVEKVVDLKPSMPTEHLVVPDRTIDAARPTDLGGTTTEPQPLLGPIIGSDPGLLVIDPPLPPPPLPYVEASVDPRYAADLQPAYPASERRAGREGRVSVKVLIGVDGRVKQVQQLAATSDAFWRAAFDQAMRKWRFKAATRGGIPVEAWRTMSLRFRLED